MAVQNLGRVVGSRIYSGTADSNSAIQSQLTGQGITPLIYDLYVSSTSGNLYQYQLVENNPTWTLLINLKGPAGTFAISKVYSSVSAMNAGYATDGVPVGGLVVIDTGNTEDPDNAKLYVKGNSAYEYLTDMSGAQGIQGPQGPAGATGQTGPQGVGITSIIKTNTSGLVDTYTITLSNNSTSTFTVTNGADGATGQTGPQGETGATPQITAQVTTLAAGSQATVTQTGSATNPVLTFGIPQGIQGKQGPQGKEGPTGPAGADGQTPTLSINADGELIATYS